MYELFMGNPRRFVGRINYPELPYLRRTYAGQVSDIQRYYRRHDKRIDSQNRLGLLLLQLPRRWDLDDAQYLRVIDDASTGVCRALGFTSSTFKGKIFEDGFTLGPKCDEVVVATSEDFDYRKAKQSWQEWKPYQYLYHSRWDLGMPIPNNTTPGKGFGVGLLNVPMLALQYRYWLTTQDTRYNEKESVFQFIGHVVLPNTLDSYLDIAFFNRMARVASDQGNPKFPTPHPFYLSDYSRRVDDLIDGVLKQMPHYTEDLQQVIAAIPALIQERLWDRLQLPNDPITRQNEWAYQLALFPYLQFAVKQILNSGDRQDLNTVYLTLYEAQQDNLLNGMGSAECLRFYRGKLAELLDQVKEVR